jgi:HEAT repeat protein
MREMLQSLVDGEDLSNDEQEVLYDAILEKSRTFPREDVVRVIDKAVGKSKKRRKKSIYVLCSMTDVPEAVKRIEAAICDPDRNIRSWVIQAIGEKKWERFAEPLNAIMLEDSDPFVRECAIQAAREIGSPVNIPALLTLTEQGDRELAHAVLWTVSFYGHPDFRPYLTDVFKKRHQSENARVISAWGLAKLGDKKAHAFLVKTLDDPDDHPGWWAKFKHKHFGAPLVAFSPGESLRAAQALCDIHGWLFEWEIESVIETQKRVAQLNTSQNYLS